jgi:hypothetical protein
MNWKLGLAVIVPLALAGCYYPPAPPPAVQIAPAPPPIYAAPAMVAGPVVDTPVLRYDNRQDRRGDRRYGRNARQYSRHHPYHKVRHTHRSNRYYDQKYCKPGQVYRRATVITKDGNSAKLPARCVSR